MVLLSTNASFASFSKNKPRSPGYRHDKEGSKILVKWQTFRAAITLQKNALEKENTDYLQAQNGSIEVEEIISKKCWYHETCRKDYTRLVKQLSQDAQKYYQA